MRRSAFRCRRPPNRIQRPYPPVHSDTLAALESTASASPQRPDPNETAQTALERLADSGLLEGQKMRHESSLSLYALLRQWRFTTRVDTGRHHFELSGLQTAFGRGLYLPHARASCAMEVVERASAFASFTYDAVLGYKTEKPLLHGNYSTLAQKGYSALDPNAMVIDVAYRDEPRCWVEGLRKTPADETPIWIPAQLRHHRQGRQHPSERPGGDLVGPHRNPCPYPHGPASMPGPADLPVLGFDALPNYASGNADRDLHLGENLLQANGCDLI